MRCLAIIPARGGSKGVPRKNLRPLAGRPLIAHAIEAARGARLVDRVVVSTDDGEIAATARRFGAEVVDRPAELSGDATASEPALGHTLQVLQEREGYRPDLLVMLQCTSPLTLPADIDGTIEALLRAGADSSFAAVPFHHFLWRPGADERADGINHDPARRSRRQEMQPQYLEAGAVYAMRVAGFLEAGHRFFGRTVLHAMPAERCLEIDEPQDFARAEAALRAQARARAQDLLPARIGALVLDFDGVMTDDRVLVLEDGREAVLCHRGDGLGLEHLRRSGLPVVVLSKETSPVVARRCQKLGLQCLQAIENKLPVLEAWAAAHRVALDEIVYVGNDVNDLACLLAVGCGVAPADAHPEARAAARLVLAAPGGHGAVREVTDLCMDARSVRISAASRLQYGT